MVIRVNKTNDSDKERKEIIKALKDIQNLLESKQNELSDLSMKMERVKRNTTADEEAIDAIDYTEGYIQDAIVELDEALEYLEEEGD